MELTANRAALHLLAARGTTSSRTSTSATGSSSYGAGRRLDFVDTDPDSLAEAIAAGLEVDVQYAPVQRDGATRAAALMAELL